MGPVPVVVGALVLNSHQEVSQVQKPVTVQALIPELAIETLDVSVLSRLPGVIKYSLSPLSLAQAASALLVNSGPMSITSVWGSPGISLSRSSTLTTRCPVIYVSISMAGHSRVNRSTMVKALILRPPTVLCEFPRSLTQ